VSGSADHARALLSAGRAREAAQAAGAIVMRRPRDTDALEVLAMALERTGQIERAIGAARRYVAAAPNRALGHQNLGSVLREGGHARQATDCFRKAIELKSDYTMAWNSYLYNLMFDSRFTREQVADERKRWGERMRARIAAAEDHPNAREPDRRLRIGYASPHFKEHAVNAFVEPIIHAHDRTAFEVFCYSDYAYADAATRRLQAAAHHWRAIAGRSDSDVLSLVRQDRIDILVDLAGHMDARRIAVFAARPAPVQVSYIGDQATTGLASMHGRISDAVVDPSDADALYTERLWRLRAFFVYQPWPQAAALSPLPAHANGHITFGCFNHSAKLSQELVAAWAAILNRVAGARIKVLTHEADPRAHWVLDEFARLGIDATRVEMTPRNWDLAAYTATLASVDIALDTFPFTGHTTTCDSLWMGVPVVTLAGDAYWKRMSAATLSAIGCADLVTASSDGYVETAAALAHGSGRLSQLRNELRGMMAALTDASRFTRELESAYRAMWRQWCAQ
jgi:predicted O-linked N-acetylglucosamine transferase (SPINDLY family)